MTTHDYRYDSSKKLINNMRSFICMNCGNKLDLPSKWPDGNVRFPESEELKNCSSTRYEWWNTNNPNNQVERAEPEFTPDQMIESFNRVTSNSDLFIRLAGIANSKQLEQFCISSMQVCIILEHEFERRFPVEYRKYQKEQYGD